MLSTCAETTLQNINTNSWSGSGDEISARQDKVIVRMDEDADVLASMWTNTLEARTIQVKIVATTTTQY